MRNTKKNALKSLAKAITQNETVKSFCFNYSEIFLSVILKLILKEDISDEEIKQMATIISLVNEGLK